MESICSEYGEAVGEDPEYGGFVHFDDGMPDRSDRGHYAEPDYGDDVHGAGASLTMHAAHDGGSCRAATGETERR